MTLDEDPQRRRNTLAALASTVALVSLSAGGALGFAAGWRMHRPAPAPGSGAGSMAGRVTTEDTHHDGRADRWTERDAAGRIARVSEDRNRDGRVDRVEIYVDGRINRVDYDSDGDGRLDATDQLGGDGRVLFRLTDRDWNTVPERWVQLDARGVVTGEWVDANQDTAPERFRGFDAAGRVTEEGSDADGDGLYEVNRMFNTRWPEGSPPVRIERDDNGDGVYERRETYARDGTLLAVNTDTDGDGVRDHLVLLGPGGVVRKEGEDRDGNGYFETWRFPVAGGVRVGHDDDDDYDLDRWDPPGPPQGWCAARCVVSAPVQVSSRTAAFVPPAVPGTP